MFGFNLTQVTNWQIIDHISIVQEEHLEHIIHTSWYILNTTTAMRTTVLKFILHIQSYMNT